MRMMMPVIKNLKTKHHFLCLKCQTKRHWKKKNSFRVCKIEQAIKSMSDREKFHILKNHGEPTKNHNSQHLTMEDITDLLEGND